MRCLALVAAVVAFMTPACQTVPTIQPKAKLAVEAPGDLKQVNYKLEVTLN